MELRIICGLLAAVIALIEYLHYRERRRLTGALLGQQPRERNQRSPTGHVVSAAERVLKRWRDSGGDNV